MKKPKLKAYLTLLISLFALNCLSCSGESELDKAINEAMHEEQADFDQPLEEGVSVRYFEETKDR